jgi:hypothetical protein
MNIRLVQDIIDKVKQIKNGPAAGADQVEKQ